MSSRLAVTSCSRASPPSSPPPARTQSPSWRSVSSWSVCARSCGSAPRPCRCAAATASTAVRTSVDADTSGKTCAKKGFCAPHGANEMSPATMEWKCATKPPSVLSARFAGTPRGFVLAMLPALMGACRSGT